MGAAVDLLGLHYSAGIFGGVVLVPIVTFLVLNRWVFRHQARRTAKFMTRRVD
jgi:hypothetical protein